MAAKNPVVSERDCKGTTFFRSSKSFSNFFSKKFSFLFHYFCNNVIIKEKPKMGYQKNNITQREAFIAILALSSQVRILSL